MTFLGEALNPGVRFPHSYPISFYAQHDWIVWINNRMLTIFKKYKIAYKEWNSFFLDYFSFFKDSEQTDIYPHY